MCSANSHRSKANDHFPTTKCYQQKNNRSNIIDQTSSTNTSSAKSHRQYLSNQSYQQEVSHQMSSTKSHRPKAIDHKSSTNWDPPSASTKTFCFLLEFTRVQPKSMIFCWNSNVRAQNPLMAAHPVGKGPAPMGGWAALPGPARAAA